MKICVYEGKYVDFEAPICMYEDQLQTLIQFFEQVYGKANAEVKPAEDAGREGMSHGGARTWSVKDLARLLGPESNAQLANKLQRTPMAVRLKRGDFAPDFIAWARKKKLTRYDERAIRKYLEERGE